MIGAAALSLHDDQHAWAYDIAQAISRKLHNRGWLRQQHSANDLSSECAQPSQHSSPSQRPDNGDGDEAMPSGPSGRNPRPLTNNREQTRDALTERFKVHVTDPSKIAARKVGRSAETVDGYRPIGVPMAWADMVEWGRTHPGFALDVMELMGLDIDRDRDAYAIFLQLQQQMRK